MLRPLSPAEARRARFRRTRARTLGDSLARTIALTAPDDPVSLLSPPGTPGELPRDQEQALAQALLLPNHLPPTWSSGLLPLPAAPDPSPDPVACRAFLREDTLRNLYLAPLVFLAPPPGQAHALAGLLDRLSRAGNPVLSPEAPGLAALAGPLGPPVRVAILSPSGASLAHSDMSRSGPATICLREPATGQRRSAGFWELCASDADGRPRPVFRTSEPDELPLLVDLVARHLILRGLAAETDAPGIEASVVVPTLGRPELEDALASLATQDLDPGQYEVIVVDNSRYASVGARVEALRRDRFGNDPARLRWVRCPVQATSAARNTGLRLCRGRLYLAMDDDAVAAPDLLSRYLAAYRQRPDLGAIGGEIHTDFSGPLPWWWRESWRRFWSHTGTLAGDLREVPPEFGPPWGTNWSARRSLMVDLGGFRHAYGRHGNALTGAGDDTSMLRVLRLAGHGVGILPQARVRHRIAPERVTLRKALLVKLDGTLLRTAFEQDGYAPRTSSLGRSLAGLAMALLAAISAPLTGSGSPHRHLLHALGESYRALAAGLDLAARVYLSVTGTPARTVPPRGSLP